MNPDEYAAKQAVISAAVAAYVYQLGKLFAAPRLPSMEWLKLLGLIFPEVKQRRSESAALAREFYDSQRSHHVPSLPRNEVDLVGSDFQVFVESMEPARRRMASAESPDNAVGQLAAQAVRDTENAGRRQIIRSVEEDQYLQRMIEEIRAIRREPEPEPSRREVESAKDTIVEHLRRQQEERNRRYETDDMPPKASSSLVQGWARVATGAETCAWCLMLVSRGPVYHEASTAGLDLPDEEAIEAIGRGADLSEFMDRWHPNCDCKVVPVFDENDWPGREAWKAAEEKWIDASRDAKELLASGEARSNNLSTETINVIRRQIDKGLLDMSRFAAIAA